MAEHADKRTRPRSKRGDPLTQVWCEHLGETRGRAPTALPLHPLILLPLALREETPRRATRLLLLLLSNCAKSNLAIRRGTNKTGTRIPPRRPQKEGTTFQILPPLLHLPPARVVVCVCIFKRFAVTRRLGPRAAQRTRWEKGRCASVRVYGDRLRVLVFFPVVVQRGRDEHRAEERAVDR